MMNFSRLFLLTASIILAVSCNKGMDGQWDMPGGNQGGGDPGQNQSWNQTGDVPEETSPVYSGLKIDDEAFNGDDVTDESFDGTITITFSQDGASVSGSVGGVTVTKSGAHVTVENSGEKKVKYILTGTSSDGSFKLYSPNKKQAIQLSDLTLTNGSGAAINNQSGKRTFVILEGTSTLGDCAVNGDGDYPSQSADEDMKAAFFSEGQLVFSGTGSLTVNAVGKAGITSDDYVRFMDGPTVTVNSASGHGVRGKDAVIVSGGTVNVTVASTATGRKCFNTDSLVYITGGNINLVNNAGAGTVDGDLTGAAGIKADLNIVIQGGTLSVTTSGKGCKCINCDGTGFFEGGTVTAVSTGDNYGSSRYGSSDNSVSSKALKFDGNMEFTGASVTATSKSHEAIESKGTIVISAGQVSATSGDDAVNSSSTMDITGGVVYACSTGNDGLDANGNLIIRGGTVFAIGCGSPEVAVDANTERNCKFYLTGGNLIAAGGIESGSYVSQPVISTSWSRTTAYSLCDGDKVLYSFTTPSSGGSGLYLSSASLVSGSSYSLIKSATVTGAETFFDGVLSLGGTASGGTSSSVTASTFSSGGGMGGFGPGGF